MFACNFAAVALFCVLTSEISCSNSFRCSDLVHCFPPPPSPNLCKNHEYKQIGYHCYKVHTLKLPFDQASAKCISEGGKLAEPKNYLDLAEVVALPRSDYWLGIRDLNGHNNWVYESSRQPIQFYNWAKGEPNDREEQCVELMGSIENGVRRTGWNDLRCRLALAFVCQMDALPPVINSPCISTTPAPTYDYKDYY